DVRRRGVRAEYPQDAEAERRGSADVSTEESSKADVVAVAGLGVSTPPAEETFSSIRLADVMLSGDLVSDEVNPLYRAQRVLPCLIAGALHHVLQLGEGDDHSVESRKRDDSGVGDLDNGEARGRSA